HEAFIGASVSQLQPPLKSLRGKIFLVSSLVPQVPERRRARHPRRSQRHVAAPDTTRDRERRRRPVRIPPRPSPPDPNQTTLPHGSNPAREVDRAIASGRAEQCQQGLDVAVKEPSARGRNRSP